MMTQHNEDDAEHWSGRVVSWLNLLIAIAVTAGSLGLFVTGYVIGTDKRISLVEERQRVVMDYVKADTAAMETHRDLMLAQIEVMKQQVGLIKLELAKHESYDDGKFGKKR